MTEARLDPRRDALLVEARLGRAPQDMLEAAVVLEAWAGVPAQAALTAARAMMRVAPGAPPPSAAATRGAAVSHPRHRALYEAEYAKQLDRLGARRQAICAERRAADKAPC
jgi:hypothetical protein